MSAINGTALAVFCALFAVHGSMNDTVKRYAPIVSVTGVSITVPSSRTRGRNPDIRPVPWASRIAGLSCVKTA